MVRHIVNTRGEVEVDPFGWKGKHDRWLKRVRQDEVDYGYFSGISSRHSRLLVEFFLDLASGKNGAKGHKKGPRSPVYMVNFRHRLSAMFRLLEERTGKKSMDFSEEQILAIFQGLRQGTIKRADGKPYLDVATIAKRFSSFWRWYIRTERRKGNIIPDIVESLDTSYDHKPKWAHFTLKDVERMAERAPKPKYKALLYFLFDSGIRAPKELMNVRVKDLDSVPKAKNQLFLTIREETSKTFGRKIKLMISAEVIKRFIKEQGLRDDDFLFTGSPVVFNRVLGTLGSGIRQGRRPETVVAAALYIAGKECGEKRTQQEIADVVGVIEITIRKRIQEISHLIK